MIPLVTLPPFNPVELILVVLLDPVVIVVAFLMGRSADQWQKLIVAGFAAAAAGALAIWLGSYLQLLPPRGPGSEAGLFVMNFIYGLVIATLAYVFLRRPVSRPRD